MKIKLGGILDLSTVDVPGKPASVIFLWGCNFRCHFCFTADTKVFTNKGIMNIKDIVVQKRNVMVLDKDGQFQKIKSFFKHKYSGKIIKIKTYYNSGHISATDSHKFYTVDENGEVVKKQAKELKKGDYLLIPIPQKTIKNITLSFLEPVKKLYLDINTKKPKVISEKLIQQIAELRKEGFSWRQIYKILNVTDYARRVYNSSYYRRLKLVNPIEITNNKIRMKGAQKQLPIQIEVSQDFARLIGYYLAEGHVTKQKRRKNSYATVFTFSKNETKYIQDVKNLIETCFDVYPTLQHNRRNNTVQITAQSGALGMFFEYYFGKNVYKKKLPLNFLFLPLIVQKELIKGIFFGDGLSKGLLLAKNGQYIPITSQLLRYQISLILLRLGIYNSRSKNYLISKSNRLFKILGQKMKNFKELRFGVLDNRYFYAKIKHIENEDVVNIDVYNIEVANSHSYTADLFAVANCYNVDLVINNKYQEVETSQIVKKIEKSKPFIDAVCITGGEPTVQAQALTELCEKLKKAGFYVKLDTNGSNPKLIKSLIEKKLVDFVALDVKAPLRPDIYSRVIGVNADEHVNAVHETMNILISSNIDYETRAPIVPGLNADPEVLRELAKDVKNAKTFVLEQFWSGKGTIDPALSGVKGLSREEMKKAAKLFKNKIVKIRTREAGEEVAKS